jgi:hypothetical protein
MHRGCSAGIDYSPNDPDDLPIVAAMLHEII